jgi:hypothetical protein
MKKRPPTELPRRDLLRAIMTGTAAAVAGDAIAVEPAAAEPKNAGEKRRARYQPDSPEVREFYRVNRYPPR